MLRNLGRLFAGAGGYTSQARTFYIPLFFHETLAIMPHNFGRLYAGVGGYASQPGILETGGFIFLKFPRGIGD